MEDSENGERKRRNGCKNINNKGLWIHGMARFCGMGKKKGSEFIPNLNLSRDNCTNYASCFQANFRRVGWFCMVKCSNARRWDRVGAICAGLQIIAGNLSKPSRERIYMGNVGG